MRNGLAAGRRCKVYENCCRSHHFLLYSAVLGISPGTTAAGRINICNFCGFFSWEPVGLSCTLRASHRSRSAPRAKFPAVLKQCGLFHFPRLLSCIRRMWDKTVCKQRFPVSCLRALGLRLLEFSDFSSWNLEKPPRRSSFSFFLSCKTCSSAVSLISAAA